MSWILLLAFFRIVMGGCADNHPSACGNGGGNGAYGFACPSLMMLGDPMMAAARADGLDHDFVYAVAGGASDQDCGKCFQVELLDAEREWRPDFRGLVVQVVNSGYDVLPYQLDLFMGAGGFGYFTACNSDCDARYCQGGGCRRAMYAGDFRAWVDAVYYDPNLCYSGGIKWLDQKANTQDLQRLCEGLVGNENKTLPKNKHTIDSCFRTNKELYHQNFVRTRSAPVRCPRHLTELTGLRRLDDSLLPDPHPGLPLDHECVGDRSRGRYCVTTMQDCCKMSCSWGGKIPQQALDSSHPCVHTCDRDGQTL